MIEPKYKQDAKHLVLQPGVRVVCSQHSTHMLLFPCKCLKSRPHVSRTPRSARSPWPLVVITPVFTSPAPLPATPAPIPTISVISPLHPVPPLPTPILHISAVRLRSPLLIHTRRASQIALHRWRRNRWPTSISEVIASGQPIVITRWYRRRRWASVAAVIAAAAVMGGSTLFVSCFISCGDTASCAVSSSVPWGLRHVLSRPTSPRSSAVVSFNFRMLLY